MRWGAVRANLVEAASAKSPSDLIAVGKNRIFNKNYGWGRFIHFFRCRRQSTEKVKAIFGKMRYQILEVSNPNFTYFDHLGKELRGEPYSIIDKEKAEKKLLQFCLYMKPLMRDVIRGKDAPYLKMVLDSKKADLNHWKKIFRQVRIFQKIKNVERTLKAPIPYIPMFKVASYKHLKKKEEHQLKHWVTSLGRSLNKRFSSFKGRGDCNYGKVRFLHRFLTDIVDIFKEMKVEGDKKCYLDVLESYIQNLGCKAFSSPDQKHLKWAKSLHPGSIIRAGGRRYKIEQVLRWDHDIPVALSLKGHPDLELVIESNEAIISLRNYANDCHHCGIIVPKMISMEEKRRAFLQERVHYPLEDFPDQTAIVELVKGLMSIPFTPAPLTKTAFGFTRQGEMRARSLLHWTDKSFKAIDKFVLELAHDSQGNLHETLYESIAKESGLNEVVKRVFY